MTPESAPQIDADYAVYDHFLKIKHRRQEYADFSDVPFSPEKLHNLDLVTLPYSGDQEKTDLYVSVTPEVLAGGKNFSDIVLPSVEDIIDEFDIKKLLRDRSLIVCFNHAFFADAPIADLSMIQALVNKGVYPDWQTAAEHSFILASRMIDVLGVDITYDAKVGHNSVTYNGLRHVANVVRTLPSSANGRNIEGLDRRVRSNHNALTRAEINYAVSRPGNIIYIAGGGTHDRLIENDTVMEIQEPERETTMMLVLARAPILYTAIKCMPSVKKGELTADSQTFIEAIALDETPSSGSIKDGYSRIGEKIGKLLPGKKGFEKLVQVALVSELS